MAGRQGHNAARPGSGEAGFQRRSTSAPELELAAMIGSEIDRLARTATKRVTAVRPSDTNTATATDIRPSATATDIRPSDTDVESTESVDAVAWVKEHFKQSRTGPGLFGPAGFTVDAAETLSRFVGNSHVTWAYSERPEYAGGGRYTNGFSGLLNFDGVDSVAAAELLTKLPDTSLDVGHNFAPKVRRLLRAAAKHPNVRLGGFIVPPSRNDERVDIDSMTVFIETDDPVAARKTIGAMIGRSNDLLEDEFQLRPCSYRGGLPGWRVWWD